jgi:hypothetical protein
MSVLKDLNIRPVYQKDIAQLDAWRRAYPDAFLELPHGLNAPGVKSAAAEKYGKLVGSLTATLAVLMDPFIHDASAAGPDVFASVYMLERALAFNAQDEGAVDAYIAVPNQSVEYHRIVEKAGYVKTCQNCTIFRRSLRPDTVPLIENGG